MDTPNPLNGPYSVVRELATGFYNNSPWLPIGGLVALIAIVTVRPDFMQRLVPITHRTQEVQTEQPTDTGHFDQEIEPISIDDIAGDQTRAKYITIIQNEFQRYDNPLDLEQDLTLLATSMFQGQENPTLNHTDKARGDEARTLVMITQDEVKFINKQGTRYQRKTGEKWNWQRIIADTAEGREMSCQLGAVLIQYRADRLQEEFPELQLPKNRTNLLRAVAASYNAGTQSTINAMNTTTADSNNFWDYIKHMSEGAQRKTTKYVIGVTAYYNGLQEGYNIKELAEDPELLFQQMTGTDRTKHIEYKTGLTQDQQTSPTQYVVCIRKGTPNIETIAIEQEVQKEDISLINGLIAGEFALITHPSAVAQRY